MPVRFVAQVHSWLSVYNVGEVAAFPPAVEDDLVARRLAERVEVPASDTQDEPEDAA